MTVYDNETFRVLNSLSDASIDEFTDRLRLQKLGYLAQELGATGWFMFSWYLHGPYSPSLTRTLYSAADIGRLGSPTDSLTSSENKIVEKMELLLGRDGLNDPHKLELYASVWYLLPNKITENVVERTVQILGERKPDFDHAEVDECISSIKQFRQKYMRDT